MREIGRNKVNNCPCCDNPQRSKSFKDYNNIDYHFCKCCGSVYQDPRIIFEYEENYWGQITDPDGNKRDLSKEREFKVKNWYGESVKFINNLKPGRLLDVGAGLGYFLSAINDNWEKHAIEISSYAIEQINNRYKNITIYKGTLGEIALKKNFFDVIMYYHVIQHISDPQKELNILYEILKPKGVLIVGTPNISSIAAKIFKGNFRLYGPSHLCLFNSRSLKDFLSNNGFNVFKREYPFWKTDYATIVNIFRMFMPWKLSPPFYGSIMTFYARKN